MSVITGKINNDGYLIDVMETEVECPICTFKFDASEKMAKAKFPIFKTKCPACNGIIGISEPIFGGLTKCFEWDCPPNVERLETTSPFTVNGKIEKEPKYKP